MVCQENKYPLARKVNGVKTVSGMLLAICGQAVLAACPRVDVFEYAYMTKGELLSAFCENAAHAIEYKEGVDEELRYAAMYKDNNLSGLLEESMERAEKLDEELKCSEGNSKNAFLILRKNHGVETVDDIACDDKTKSSFSLCIAPEVAEAVRPGTACGTAKPGEGV